MRRFAAEATGIAPAYAPIPGPYARKASHPGHGSRLSTLLRLDTRRYPDPPLAKPRIRARGSRLGTLLRLDTRRYPNTPAITQTGGAVVPVQRSDRTGPEAAHRLANLSNTQLARLPGRGPIDFKHRE